MDHQHLPELIRKFREGKATPGEVEQLQSAWDQALDDRQLLQSLPVEEQQILRAAMFRNIRDQIRQTEARRPEARQIPLVSTRGSMVWKIAAAVALLVLSSLILWQFMFRSGLQTEQTAFGERRLITLPDQSTAVLNGNSSIRFASRWETAGTREVWVEGEVYFSVQHTASHQKFVVHTPDDMHVEVLGTKFTVSNRRGQTNVVLQEGKVKVSRESQTYVMKPGEMVSYSPQRSRLVPRLVNAEMATSWRNNLLVYRDETIGSIVSRLQDSHGITVEFRNESLKEEVFNGSVPADSVEQLFEKFEKLYSVSVTRQGDVYVIE